MTFRGSLSRTVLAVSVPHGYTLSAGGCLAIAGEQHHHADAPSIFLFVAGASAAFAFLVALSRAHRSHAAPMPSLRGKVAFNVLPVVVVPAVAAVCAPISSAPVGFAASGLLATLIYLAGVAFLNTLVTRSLPHGEDGPADDPTTAGREALPVRRPAEDTAQGAAHECFPITT